MICDILLLIAPIALIVSFFFPKFWYKILPKSKDVQIGWKCDH